MNAVAGVMSGERFRSFMGDTSIDFDDDDDASRGGVGGADEQDLPGATQKIAYENGMRVGLSTLEICMRRAMCVDERDWPRKVEAGVLSSIWKTYPRDGQDLQYLFLLMQPFYTRRAVGNLMHREVKTVCAAVARLMDFVARGEAAIGKRGRRKIPVDVDSMTETQLAEWAMTGRAPSMQGRKSRIVEVATKAAAVKVAAVKVAAVKPVATKAPITRIRVPRRLVLVPVQAPAESVVKRVWGTTKPRARRIKTPDFTAPQLDFGVAFGEGWGIPPPTPGAPVSGMVVH
ncbi:MAG: hypothetical protein ACYDEV_12350 [Acidiferrobacter sp.]